MRHLAASQSAVGHGNAAAFILLGPRDPDCDQGFGHLTRFAAAGQYLAQFVGTRNEGEMSAAVADATVELRAYGWRIASRMGATAVSVVNAQTRPHLFVCYSHDDERRVLPVVQWLRQSGVQTWFDASIRGGAVWRREVAEALNVATHLLFFVSSSSLGSDHCDSEVQYALDHSKIVVPVFLDDVALTPSFSVALHRVQALHAYRLSANELRSRLLDSMAAKPTTLPTQAASNDGGTLFEAPVKYAKSGDVHIAYRVFGEGPHDIVLVPGTISHVEIYWELPINAYLLKRLASFARVIVFDKRGQGLSDRVADMTLEERTGDLRAVMDAVGSKQATIYGWSEGGQMCVTFSATYAERTVALVLFGCFAQSAPTDDTERFLKDFSSHWGEGVSVAHNAPSRINDEAFVQWFARFERAAASPGSLVALYRASYGNDVRHLLPSIHVPTLILHRVGDSTVRVEEGRYLAEHIPGAKYVELPGIDHMLQALDQDVLDFMLDEIEDFVTGAHHRPEPDRVLTTLMFANIVKSPDPAAELGDQRWLDQRESFFTAARTELSACRGREVDAGAEDGLLACFDGPARAIRCACSLRDRLRPLGIQLQVGLHTGECEVRGDRLGGIALSIATGIASTAGADEILVSSTVKDLVAGSGLRFADRGMKDLTGVSDEWRVLVVQ